MKTARSLGPIEQDANAAVGSGKADHDPGLADELRTTLGAQPGELESRSYLELQTFIFVTVTYPVLRVHCDTVQKIYGCSTIELTDETLAMRPQSNANLHLKIHPHIALSLCDNQNAMKALIDAS